VRELKEGARPVEPDASVVTSPCDAVVGACGRMQGSTLIQAKGRTYSVEDLVQDESAARALSGGVFVTLRLRANMYHRFHAPYECRVEAVRYVPGDVWNVNPAAVKRVERLFCRNERAVLWTRLEPSGTPLVLVPVAAILVAGIRLGFIPGPLRARGAAAIPCDATFSKGDEMGWFEHGSTIIVLGPPALGLDGSVRPGTELRMGQPLLRLGEAGAQDATAGSVSAAGGAISTR
jgi:phosphatidylserine decarboxylase